MWGKAVERSATRSVFGSKTLKRAVAGLTMRLRAMLVGPADARTEEREAGLEFQTAAGAADKLVGTAENNFKRTAGLHR
jgi:hypothetical protein